MNALKASKGTDCNNLSSKRGSEDKFVNKTRTSDWYYWLFRSSEETVTSSEFVASDEHRWNVEYKRFDPSNPETLMWPFELSPLKP